jgi:hypothetical protein
VSVQKRQLPFWDAKSWYNHVNSKSACVHITKGIARFKMYSGYAFLMEISGEFLLAECALLGWSGKYLVRYTK